MRVWLALAVAVASSAGLAARADVVLHAKGNASAISQPNVKVTGIASGQLSYTTDSGATRSLDLADVQQITADGQSGFNTAEAAYAAHNPGAAMTAYQAALDGSGPDWVKIRSAQRLAELAAASHRYDAQVAAYAALVSRDPESATAARPAAPQPNDPYLDAALGIVTRAVSSVPSAQKSALLGVQLDIYRAKGDKAGFNQALQQLVNAGGATAADQAMLKLAAADVALDAKQYGQAESAIQQNRALFTEPGQQVDALFVLAQARDGQAGGAAGPDSLKDVALAYMRVVTFGSPLNGRPHVAESLLRVAQIEEKLSDAKGALALYQQLATDPAYAASPAVADAKKAAARLKK